MKLEDIIKNFIETQINRSAILAGLRFENDQLMLKFALNVVTHVYFLFITNVKNTKHATR